MVLAKPAASPWEINDTAGRLRQYLNRYAKFVPPSEEVLCQAQIVFSKTAFFVTTTLVQIRDKEKDHFFMVSSGEA